MSKVLRTSKAEEDLLDIWEYVANDDPGAADRLLDEVATAIDTLSENPLAGRLREELAPRLRSFPVGNYLIFYRAKDGGILVVRVLHGAARDLPELL